MEPILFDAGQLGRFPATRSLGREGRDRLEDKIAGKQHIDLTIDFTSVEAMTISFADEFLGKFLSTFDTMKTDATIKLAGLNTENLEAVEICLERRETQAVVMKLDGSLALVGDPILADTFDALPQDKEFKANDVAEDLQLSAQNANNRLKRLVAAGALRKTRSAAPSRGGKEFVYTTVTADVPDAQPLVDA